MSQSRKLWTLREDEAIRSLVKKWGLKKWAEISKQMESKYKLYGRTGKQCRQRWHNHLDPNVNKSDWTQQEERIIFKAHRNHGNQWTNIAKLLNGRTDNAIKNFFYSTLRKSLRRVDKIIGSKGSASLIKQIKPNILSEIFYFSGLAERQVSEQNEQIVQNCKDLQQILLQFSQQKDQTTLKQQDRIKLERLFHQILTHNKVSEKKEKKQEKISISRIRTRRSIQKDIEGPQIISQNSTKDLANENIEIYPQKHMRKIQSNMILQNNKHFSFDNSLSIEPTLFRRRSSRISSRQKSKQFDIELNNEEECLNNNSPSISHYFRRTPLRPTPKQIIELPNRLYQKFSNFQLNQVVEGLKRQIDKKNITP